ncbi:Uncharacterised protein [Serratia quinivorans]|nr:Uncharacterised protein [Serratia quinivorans]
MLRRLHAAIQRGVPRQAVNGGALQQGAFVDAAVVAAVLAAGQAVLESAFTLQHRQRGKGHQDMLFAAVGLFNGDLQVAAAAGGVHVVNHKGTGGDVGAVNLIAVLAHYHLGIGTGDTAHHRGIAAQAVGQHLVVGGHLHAAKGHRVKHFGRGIAVTEGQLALQGDQVALGVGVDGVPFILAVAAAAPGGVVAQSPGAEVQAGAQVGVLAVAVTAVAAACGVIGAAEAVVEQQGGDALVPLGGRHIAPGLAGQRGLGNTECQLLAVKQQAGRGLGNGGDISAGGIGGPEGGELSDAHAVIGEFGDADAGLQALTVSPGGKGHGAGIDLLIVDQHIDPVIAR